jgi:hypothetical protein
MRQFAQAERMADSVAREFPSPVARSYTYVVKATTFAAAGDLDRSEQLFDSLSGAAAGSSRSMALQTSAFIALSRARSVDALSRLAAYRANDARNGVRALPLNDSLAMSNYDATSAEQPLRAVKRLDAALAATPFNTLAIPDRDYFCAATVYSRAGRVDKAKAIRGRSSEGRALLPDVRGSMEARRSRAAASGGGDPQAPGTVEQDRTLRLHPARRSARARKRRELGDLFCIL